MAGMSPLKVVEFVRGMENSRRKTFWAPEKPSDRAPELAVEIIGKIGKARFTV